MGSLRTSSVTGDPQRQPHVGRTLFRFRFRYLPFSSSHSSDSVLVRTPHELTSHPVGWLTWNVTFPTFRSRPPSVQIRTPSDRPKQSSTSWVLANPGLATLRHPSIVHSTGLCG